MLNFKSIQLSYFVSYLILYH